MSLDNAAPEDIKWRKALRSLGNGNCVQVAPAAVGVAVRDSKDPDGFALALAAESWRAFTHAARGGNFDVR